MLIARVGGERVGLHAPHEIQYLLELVQLPNDAADGLAAAADGSRQTALRARVLVPRLSAHVAELHNRPVRQFVGTSPPGRKRLVKDVLEHVSASHSR